MTAPSIRLQFGAIALFLLGCGDAAPTADDGPDDGPLAADALPADGGVDGQAPDSSVAACPDGVTQLYAPFESTELHTFPDAILAEPDPTTPTGLRLIADGERFPWLANLPGLLQPIASQLAGLSGFGTNGALMLRFDGPISPPPDSVEGTTETPTLRLFDLGATPPQRLAYRAYLKDEDRTLFVQPLRPLRPGQPHLLVMTRGYPAAAADCIQPSEFMAATLEGGTELPPQQTELAARLSEALEAVDIVPTEVAAATTFTTQADLEVMYAVARDIKERQFAWRGAPECQDVGPMRHCVGAFKVWDYRADKHIQGPRPSDQRFVPVQTWIPRNADGPVPVILYAHGLNDRAASARFLLDDAAEMGFGVVASEAVYHGDHPTGQDSEDLPALRFLGLNIGLFQLDPMILRGSFNQTTAERLQLLQLLRNQPDVDGDGDDDIDPSWIRYYGVSLGGMLGPSLTALDDSIGAAVFSVAGGRLLDFATGTGQIDALRPLIEDLAGGADRLDRLLPVAQTLVDAADPATYAAHVLRDRRDGASHGPEILMPVAVEDDTVPPSTGKALARALGLAHIRPVYEDVATLEVVEAPYEGATPGTPDTAGFFQYDRVTYGDGVRPASHGNLPVSAEGRIQAMHFLRTWRRSGDAEIVDPYSVNETPER